MKTFVLVITLLLFTAATAILTAFRPVIMSSVFSNPNIGYYPGSDAVDNNFDTF
jgi:hypothetical protein